MSGQVRRGFLVFGRVQGVGFRWWTAREAEKLGVRGTVRNRADGSVEVMSIAEPDQLERLERAIRRGPPMSLVERVETVECSLATTHEGFTILR